MERKQNFEIKSWNSEALLAVQLIEHESLSSAFSLSFPNMLSLTIIWVKNKRKQRWNVNDLNACICSFVKCIMHLQCFSSYFGHKSRGKWFAYDIVNFLSNFSGKMSFHANLSLHIACCRVGFLGWLVTCFFKAQKGEKNHINRPKTSTTASPLLSFMATFSLLKKYHNEHKQPCRWSTVNYRI